MVPKVRRGHEPQQSDLLDQLKKAKEIRLLTEKKKCLKELDEKIENFDQEVKRLSDKRDE